MERNFSERVTCKVFEVALRKLPGCHYRFTLRYSGLESFILATPLPVREGSLSAQIDNIFIVQVDVLVTKVLNAFVIGFTVWV